MQIRVHSRASAARANLTHLLQRCGSSTLEFLREYRTKYPPREPSADAMRPQDEQRFVPPRDYSDHLDHHRNFFAAVRSRKPVAEDSTFGFRAAGPALLSNISYFEQRVCGWDPENMRMKG